VKVVHFPGALQLRIFPSCQEFSLSRYALDLLGLYANAETVGLSDRQGVPSARPERAQANDIDEYRDTDEPGSITNASIGRHIRKP
jgi:hypothetical protein